MGRWNDRPDCMECGKPYFAIGRCKPCYVKYRRARVRQGLPASTPKVLEPCTCGRQAVAKGECLKCYKLRRRKERRESLPNGGRCTVAKLHEWTTAGRCRKCGAARPTQI